MSVRSLLAASWMLLLAPPVAADPEVAPGALAPGTMDGTWGSVFVPERYGQSTICDPIRDRLIVYGGSRLLFCEGRTDAWALSLSAPSAWEGLEPSGSPAPDRYYHGAIYDPVGDRMIVFGGRNCSGPLNDVWELSLSGAATWTQLAPTGTPPAGRGYHATIYDPVRDRMIVFDGGNGSLIFGEVWALSLSGTPAWTLLAPSGAPPSARNVSSAIYDPVRDRMVVFGGYDGAQMLNDVWTLSLSDSPAWTQLIPTSTPPSARTWSGVVYDAARDAMVVFGGNSGAGYLNDVWELSLGDTPTWTRRGSEGSPPPVGSQPYNVVHDTVHSRMVVFGGAYTAGAWALPLDGSAGWATLASSSSLPTVREDHSAVYDSARGSMLVFGGFYDSPQSSFQSHPLNDVWELPVSQPGPWAQLAPAGAPPTRRSEHSAIYDPVRDRMIVFGGYSYLPQVYPHSYYFNDVWALSFAGTPAWTQLAPAGTPPSARFLHTAIYDPAGDRMIVFGGLNDSGTSVNELWSLSLSDPPTWEQLAPAGTPPAGRNSHVAIYDPPRGRMLLHGGSNASLTFDELWELSLGNTPAWTMLAPGGAVPGAMTGHNAVHDPVRDRMVVYHYPTEAWALSLGDAPAWTLLMPTGAWPVPRRHGSSIYDPLNDRMLIFGGMNSSWQDVNDTWELRWDFFRPVDVPPERLAAIGLRPPAPNPARGTTTVSYALARAGHAQLEVYDVSGRLVRRLVDGERPAGAGQTIWDGTDAAGAKREAGIYFVRLLAPGCRETRRLVLLH
jgi:hypothetical protein